MPGVIDHVDLVVADFAASKAFFQAALRPLGFVLLRETEGNASVEEFFKAARANGGREHHAPAYHPEFHPRYYAAFVWDLDGNHIEAVNHQG